MRGLLLNLSNVAFAAFAAAHRPRSDPAGLIFAGASSVTDWIQAVSAAAIALLTVMLVAYGRRGWETARQAANAAADAADAARRDILLTHRPRLAVRNVMLDGLEVLTPSASFVQIEAAWNGSRKELVVRIANIGNLPCRAVAAEGGILVGPKLPMKRPYDDGTPLAALSVVVESGADRDLRFPAEFATPQLYEILNSGLTFYAYALVDYVDDAGVRRQMACCHRWDYESGRFQPVDDAAYSYSD